MGCMAVKVGRRSRREGFGGCEMSLPNSKVQVSNTKLYFTLPTISILEITPRNSGRDTGFHVRPAGGTGAREAGK